MVGKKDYNKGKRPAMQQNQHPAHNMPVPENDGAQLPSSPMPMPPIRANDGGAPA
jgi:hypothetical protein